MRRVGLAAHTGLAWIVLLLIVLQFFLAGLGVFGAESFSAHEDVGAALHGLSLLVLLLTIAVRRNRVDLILAVSLFVLMQIQVALPDARDDAPGLAAMHVPNAVLLLVVVEHLARRSLRPPPGDAAPSGAPA
jgi:uncharacterized protein DUF6220